MAQRPVFLSEKTRKGAVSYRTLPIQGSHSDSQPTLKRRNSVSLDGTMLPAPRLTFASIYDIKQMIGEGISSQVYLAQHKKTQEQVAVKIVPKKILINNMELAHEIGILKRIKHRYIIELKDVFITEVHMQIVMELAEGTELFDEICMRKNFSEADAKDIIVKLLDAVGYLHREGIAHRDLKPENIMFVEQEDGTKNLKVIDFGFARNCDENNPLDTAAGTLGYKAPEILKGLPYSTKADIWSLGVISYILLVGFPPFFSDPTDCQDENTLMNAPFWTLFNDETASLLDSIKNGSIEYPPNFWNQISSNGKEFVQCLLKVDPTIRYSAMDALKHPWIKPQKDAVPYDDDEDQAEDAEQDQINSKEPEIPPVEITLPTEPEPKTPEPEPEPKKPEPKTEVKPEVKPQAKPVEPKIEPGKLSNPKPEPAKVIPPPKTAESTDSKSVVARMGAKFNASGQTHKSAPTTPTPAISHSLGTKKPKTPLPSQTFLQKTAQLYQRRKSTLFHSMGNQEQAFQTELVNSGVPELDRVANHVAIDEESGEIKEIAEEPSPRMEQKNPLSGASNSLNPGTASEKPTQPMPPKPSSDTGHEWNTLSKPGFCAHCDEFIWGLASPAGLKCTKCKISIHAECEPKVAICVHKRLTEITKQPRPAFAKSVTERAPYNDTRSPKTQPKVGGVGGVGGGLGGGIERRPLVRNITANSESPSLRVDAKKLAEEAARARSRAPEPNSLSPKPTTKSPVAVPRVPGLLRSATDREPTQAATARAQLITVTSDSSRDNRRSWQKEETVSSSSTSEANRGRRSSNSKKDSDEAKQVEVTKPSTSKDEGGMKRKVSKGAVPAIGARQKLTQSSNT